MCGIAGIISLNSERGSHREAAGLGGVSAEMRIEKMIAHMHHRGPDDRGITDCGLRIANLDADIGNAKSEMGDSLHVCLGNTRLAILDLSQAAHQPMVDACTGNWITYNGEVYDFQNLRLQLNDESLPWKSQSDTEVILRAYGKWGTDCLHRLRGMFALAIWDNDRQELLLARDRFGIKPLYYYSTDKLFVFASEIRTLLASGLVPRKLSVEGVASYLQSGAVRSPLTIIEGVRSLLPGHHLSVKSNGDELQIEERIYATVAPDQPTDGGIADCGLRIADCDKEQRAKGEGQRADGGSIADRAEAVALLRQTLEDSVRAHLVSDVPVAAFLSGGIDSSALVALMCQVAEEPPQTFTVTFSEKGFSEESFARLVAQQFQTRHHEIHLSEAALLKMLPDALAAMDQPTIDGINTYVISQAVSEAGIKVALSGLGADELFAGYPSFRRVQRLRGLASVPGSLRRAVARAGRAVASNSVQQRKGWDLLAAGATPENAYTISRQLFSSEEVAALMGRDWQSEEPRINKSAIRDPQFEVSAPGWPDDINAVSLLEMTGYMANMLLRDTDQMSMAHSLEVRVPYVDAEVVSLVLGLQGSWKVGGSRPKPLLLDALGDLLPEKILRRRKMGFVLPFERWMHTVLRPEMLETFSNGSSLKAIGISESGRAIWQTFDWTPRRERWARPWALYVLKRWCELNGVGL